MLSVKEFKKLLNKKPGTYSKEEIQTIGEAHKQLDHVEKDWTKLARCIGWAGSGESLRSFINHNMKRNGTLKKNENLFSDRTIDELTGDDMEEKKQELFKQQQKTRDEWTAYRRLLREDARIESMKDAIRDCVKGLRELPRHPRVTYKPSRNHTQMVMPIADLHIGVDCKNSYNEYNTEIAIARMRKYTEEVIRLCELYKVEELDVISLGDLIHGIIHTNARIDEECDVITQVMTAAEIIADVLNTLQYVVPKVTFRDVLDNHARVLADKKQNIEIENFGRLITWYLKERLHGSKIEFPDDNIDPSIGRIDLNNGKVLMFAHGHLDSKTNSFQNMVGITGEFVDYILLAHYHNASLHSYQNCKVIVSGSVVGTEEYAYSHRLMCHPSQNILIFDDAHNLTMVEVDLKDARIED